MAPLANLPKKMRIFFLFLLLTCTTVVAAHNRRTLHQPFFPQDDPVIPPVQPPAQPPVKPPTVLPPSSPSSNIPFLSTPTTTPPNDQPFFQAFPSPPPPPSSSSSSASFPANISSLNLPTSPEPKSVSSKLIPIGITLAIAAVVVLCIVFVLRIQRRRRYHGDSQSFSDEKAQGAYNSSRVVFGAAASNGGGGSGGGHNSYNRIPKLTRPSQTSSEFLYLGTLVNSHGGIDATSTSGRDNRGEEDSSLQKVGSPELRPLPPLSGSCGGRGQTILQNSGFDNSELESRDEEFEEFYSPRASEGDGSGSRRPLAAAATGNYQTRRSIGSGSSSSYSSSSSGSPARSISLSISPPVSLSPRNSRLKSPDLVAIQTAAPPSRPAPPPPPPPHPLLIPSPDVGLSKDSLESSPRLSNSSNDQTSPLARIPPPPPPPTKHPEIRTPATRLQPMLNPPVLIKPARPVPVTSHQPLISPIEMLPGKQENLETNEKTPKPKLKPLHWDKVRASSDREMVWDHIKSSSFKLNEEMIETLFIVKPPNASNSNEKSTIKCPILPSSSSHENQVLDPKKSQNIAIALRVLSVTIEEVCDALLEGNADTLGTELLESLLKMAPTKEEERKLKEHRDDSPVKLGTAEKFLKAVLDVPFAFKRVGALLYVSNFDSEVEYLKRSFHTLEAACEELRNNRMFLKLLEAVLKTGNRMNVGTNRGGAQAFKLDTLLKLIDIKGTDGKTTLLHFVVQEIVRSEGARLSNTTTNQTAKPTVHDDSQCRNLGLQVVSSLSSGLSNVKKAAAMDSEVLNRDVVRLSNGIANIVEVVRVIEAADGSKKTKFSESVNKFLKMAQEEVIKIQAQESVSLSVVKEITEYFHGNSAKEEAHPLRIFMVVRDFLTVVDRVCKEVGSINDRIMLSSAHKFPVPVNPIPVFDGFHGRPHYSSSDDESSSSSSM